MADALSFCLVSTFYPPANFGGDGIQVQRVARGLARRGHRVRVVHNPVAYDMLSSIPRESPDEEPGVEVVTSPASRLTTAGTYLTGQPAGYRHRLAAQLAGFDVVSFNNPSLLGGPGSLGLGDGVRLYTTHEHWLLCPTHVLFRNGREICQRRTCFSCTLSYHRPPQAWRSTKLLERSVANLDALLCPSRFTAALHREFYPTARVEVLPLFAPTVDALPQRPPESCDAPFFLYAGRLEPVKGVDALIRAFVDVRGADLVVAGDGSEAASLERLAANAPNIRFLGRLPTAEVARLCAEARALVIPSAGYETFGMVGVEAMSRGTPVVVRDLGPLPELVEAGGGRTFDTERTLTALLQDLVDDPSEARRLGDEARELAQDLFSETRYFRRFFGIIEDVARTREKPVLADAAARASRQ